MLVGVLTGDTLSAVVSAGLVLAVAGVLLASREPAAEAARPARRAPGGRASRSRSWPPAASARTSCSPTWRPTSPCSGCSSSSRVVALPVLVLAGRARAAARRPRTRGPLLAAGALDVTATGLYGLANREGSLSIVAVVGSLYPVMTVLLARIVLRERLARVQAVGVAAALAGVALIAAG